MRNKNKPARLVKKHRSTRNSESLKYSLVSLCEDFVIKDCTQNLQIAFMPQTSPSIKRRLWLS